MSDPVSASGEAAELTPELLRQWPLPQPDPEGDKEERGRILVVGGSREMPGAAILAGEAAMRAGAGKLRLMVPRSAAAITAAALPEGRVFTFDEAENGAPVEDAWTEIGRMAAQTRVALFGPGMLDEDEISTRVRKLLAQEDAPAAVVDAAALFALKQGSVVHAPCIATPHAGEMASLIGIEKDAVRADPAGVARRAATELGCVIALKGAETYIAAPDGRLCVNRAGNVGLATSGSGDVLAGVIAGLLARGAEPLQAAAWGVALHARAGDALARRIGPLGYLARELPAEIPALMRELGGA